MGRTKAKGGPTPHLQLRHQWWRCHDAPHFGPAPSQAVAFTMSVRTRLLPIQDEWRPAGTIRAVPVEAVDQDSLLERALPTRPRRQEADLDHLTLDHPARREPPPRDVLPRVENGL